MLPHWKRELLPKEGPLVPLECLNTTSTATANMPLLLSLLLPQKHNCRMLHFKAVSACVQYFHRVAERNRNQNLSPQFQQKSKHMVLLRIWHKGNDRNWKYWTGTHPIIEDTFFAWRYDKIFRKYLTAKWAEENIWVDFLRLDKYLLID